MKGRGAGGLLVLAPAALSVGVLLAQPPPSDATSNPLATNPAAAAAGRAVYNQACQSCHGTAGQGDRGPALTTTRLVHGDDDADVFHTIRAGVPGTQMPPFRALRDEQIWQLVTYIRSLQSATPAGRAGADVAAAPGGNAAAGEGVFFGKAACVTCHEVNGRGGIAGPDLSTAARLPAAALRQAIVDPNAGPQTATVVVETGEGRTIRGVRRNEDTFSVQMVDAAGQLYLLDKMKLASMRVENRSLMPADYAARLSPAEIADLVAYLQTLGGRDLGPTAAQPLAGGVTAARLRSARAEPQNWLMYWGDYQGTHYSSLAQIDAATCGSSRRYGPCRCRATPSSKGRRWSSTA